jgi:tetratricopeptide (TPR) repeat protein
MQVRSPGASALLSIGAWVFAAAMAGHGTAQARCAQPTAWLTASEGSVELRRAVAADAAQPSGWQPAAREEVLCPGDTLRTGDRSRAALRLANETTLRLDQYTTLTLGAPAAEGAALLELPRGTLNVLTRTPRPFRVRTPYINAGVEGTEFLVRVDADSAQVVVFEGAVRAQNALGDLALAGGEVATATGQAAPQRSRLIRPADAVQWALHYPSLLEGRAEHAPPGAEPAPSPPALREADELRRAGRHADALLRLDAVPEADRTPRLLAQRAELLLSVGRVDEARADLLGALRLDPQASEPHALQAIVAVVRNERGEALQLAQRAVELDGSGAAARIALSYAEQAHFRIDAALASAEKAAELAPASALAWARVAELRMSVGDLDGALAAAQRAVQIDPLLARTQSVLGFAYLTRLQTAAARQTFDKAIEYDEGDPLPRLGLGLAMIRGGELGAGRAQIEIAASLDPLNSLLRSYLGKAYYEEKRNRLAASQFGLAMHLDPNDPTPYLYGAIQKQAENRPVDALRDFETSIDLNDNRAPYRSRLLLDQDLAAKNASLAKVFDQLSFEQLGLGEAVKSLAADPANYSAHRFLADMYARKPRHENARISELLQAQLLQPANVAGIQPQFADTDMFVPQFAGSAGAAFNEFNPLFARDGLSATATATAGSNRTLANDLVVTNNIGKASINFGQFHYETDGFRENNELRQDIYDLLLHVSASAQTSLQAGVRYTESVQGDRRVRFGNWGFSNSLEQKREAVFARLGARHSISAQAEAIFSLNYRDAAFERSEALPSQGLKTDQAGYLAEYQQLFRSAGMSALGGFGYSRSTDHAAPFGRAEVDGNIRHSNAYGYAYLAPSRNISVTLGLSADAFEQTRAGVDRSQLNPKFGLVWSATEDTVVRAAAFRFLKRALASSQTIEPTQVAGFSQFFDDFNGTASTTYGLGLDHKLSPSTFAGLEVSARNLRFAVPGDGRRTTWEERYGQLYLNWLPSSAVALSAKVDIEKFDRKRFAGVNGFNQLKTRSWRLAASYFGLNGMTFRVTTHHISQSGVFLEEVGPRSNGEDSFWLVDGDVEYRLPGRRGLLGLSVRNLFNRSFHLQQDIDPTKPTPFRFEPERQVFVRVVLSF